MFKQLAIHRHRGVHIDLRFRSQATPGLVGKRKVDGMNRVESEERVVGVPGRSRFTRVFRHFRRIPRQGFGRRVSATGLGPDGFWRDTT